MDRTKVVLNSCERSKNGTNQIVLAAAACGAVVMTDENIFMREHFKDGEEVILYRYDELDWLNDEVKAYISDEGMRNDIAEKGHLAVVSGHTWDHRARDLLEKLLEIKK